MSDGHTRRSDRKLFSAPGLARMGTTVEDVLTHHLRCFGKADLPGIVADYAADARIFTPDGIVRGSEAIRGFFAKVFEDHVKPGLDFHMIRQEVDGDTAY